MKLVFSPSGFDDTSNVIFNARRNEKQEFKFIDSSPGRQQNSLLWIKGKTDFIA